MKLFHVQTPQSLGVIQAENVFDAQVYAFRKECAGKVSPIRIEEVEIETFDEPTREFVLPVPVGA